MYHQLDLFVAGQTDIKQQGNTAVLLEPQPLRDGVEFANVQRVFEESKTFQFTAPNRITSPRDVAYIFKQLETSSIENSFAVLVKEHKPTVLHLAIGTFSRVMIPMEPIMAADKRIHADEIYFIHNHPSGKVVASNADMAIYTNMRQIFGERLQPGIIINTRSGHYGMFTGDNPAIGPETIATEENQTYAIPTYSFSKLVFNKNYREAGFVRSSMDVAAFVSGQRLGDRPKLSYIILSNSNEIQANVHTHYSKLKAPDYMPLAKRIADDIITYGGASIITYGSCTLNASEVRRLQKNLREAIPSESGNVLLDHINIKNNINVGLTSSFAAAAEKIYSYESAADEGWLREPKQSYGKQQQDGKSATDKAFEQFADMMIEKIESIKDNWQKPWFTEGAMLWPKNISGREYNGSNALMLMFLGEKEGYKLPYYCTFNQVRQMNEDAKGGEKVFVRKGEKSFPVIYPTITCIHKETHQKIKYEDYKNLSEEEQSKYNVYPSTQVFHVFNVAQTNLQEARPELWKKLAAEAKAPEIASGQEYSFAPMDRMVKDNLWICPIKPKYQDNAYYNLTNNEIVVPEKAQFRTGQAYYGTLFHEMTHSTGAEGVLDRLKVRNHDAYAREELVAEMGAALVAQRYGMSRHIKEDSCAYLKHWLKELRESPQFIKTVLSDTRKATAIITQKVDEIAQKIKAEQSMTPAKINGMELSAEQRRTLSDGGVIQVPSKIFPEKTIGVKLDADGKPVASAQVKQDKEQVCVMTEEDYLASKGYGFNGFGDAALHKGNYQDRPGQALLERQHQKDKTYAERREELRKEYAEKLASGEIRKPTKLEQLKKVASGHDDNASVQAARRLLQKRGISL